MATKKKNSKASGVNLSQFVRDRPNMSVAEIIEEGKKQGLTVKAGLVYNVRSTAKAKGSAAKASRASRKVGVTVARISSPNSLDGMIRNIVREEIKRFFSER